MKRQVRDLRNKISILLTFALGSGIEANSRLKEYLAEKTSAAGLNFYFPKPVFTSDNAAMIAAAGTAKLQRGETASLAVSPDPNMRLA